MINQEFCKRLTPNKSVFDWFVQRKYLPTSSTSIDVTELEEEIAATCIKQVPYIVISLISGLGLWWPSGLKHILTYHSASHCLGLNLLM